MTTFVRDNDVLDIHFPGFSCGVVLKKIMEGITMTILIEIVFSIFLILYKQKLSNQ